MDERRSARFCPGIDPAWQLPLMLDRSMTTGSLPRRACGVWEPRTTCAELQSACRASSSCGKDPKMLDRLLGAPPQTLGPGSTGGSNYLQFSGFDPLIRGYDLLNCR